MKLLESFGNIFKVAELRNRLLWTFGLLFVFRIGSHIAMPGVNQSAIEEFQKQMAENNATLWRMMQIFSGGALGNLALFSLGIMPYITASIIMQLMTKVSPRLEAISKEGPSGQRKIQQYTRYATVPVCLLQAFFAWQQLSSASAARVVEGGIPLIFPGALAATPIMMGGAIFIMWLGEQISERGLGNGASVLIMAGIVARMPDAVISMVQDSIKGDLPADGIAIILGVYLLTIVGVVYVTQAQRRIPLQHAKHIRGRRMSQGGRNYLPLKVNTAGVMPVIFASSLLIIPQLIAGVTGWDGLSVTLMPGQFPYTMFFIVMIFFFSYFWTYLFFQPNEIALQLKESGSFVPGLRPGENTAAYLNGILARITLCGAAFLCIIALLPDLVGAALGQIGRDVQSYQLAFLGGTGILIVVGVGLDIIQKIESYLLMHHYGGFLGSGKTRGRR